MKCKYCGRKLVPYITDPDVVKNFCPECDDIPLGAKPSAWPTFIDLVSTPAYKAGKHDEDGDK